MPFFGHTAIHKPQPLHRSISIIILPAIFSSCVLRIAYIVLSASGGLRVGTPKSFNHQSIKDFNRADCFCKGERRHVMGWKGNIVYSR
jgi:hypothetical protein